MRRQVKDFLKGKRLLLAGGALVVVGVAGGALFLMQSERTLPPNESFSEPVELSDLTLRGLDNNPVAFSRKSGSVRVIGIFASWCPYCAEHLRVLSDFAREHGDVEVVAVNRAEQYEVAHAYLRENSADNVTLLLDPEDTYYHSVGGQAMPEVVIADTSGTILSHLRGPVTKERLEEAYRASVQ